MSAHTIKLACWNLRFWHDYLLITCCKLRGVGLAARRGLLAACLPTKLTHKASKNNFIGKSSSEGRGRAKQKSTDSLTSSCSNTHARSQVSNAHISRVKSHSSFSSRSQSLVLSLSPNSTFYTFTSALSLLYLAHGNRLPFHKSDALNPPWSFWALLQHPRELRIRWFHTQKMSTDSSAVTCFCG